MKVAVGSSNPIKIKAVSNVLKTIWPKAQVIGTKVDPGISEMPTSDEEAIQGAKNRAQLALKNTQADYGMGIEGFTHNTPHGMLLSHWTAVVNKQKEIGLGHGGGFMLPKVIADQINNGRELGPVMDELTGHHNTKQTHGTVGYLTNGLVPRTQAFERSIIFALTRFTHLMYENEDVH